VGKVLPDTPRRRLPACIRQRRKDLRGPENMPPRPA